MLQECRFLFPENIFVYVLNGKRILTAFQAIETPGKWMQLLWMNQRKIVGNKFLTLFSLLFLLYQKNYF